MKTVMLIISLLLSTSVIADVVCEDLDTSTDIVKDLYVIGEDCVGYMFGSVDNFVTLFTDNRLDLVITELDTQIVKYDGNTNVRPLWYFLRSYQFAAFNVGIDISDSRIESFVKVLNKFGEIDVSILILNIDENNTSVSEWIMFVTAVRIPHRANYATVLTILESFSATRINDSHNNSVLVNNIMSFLFRSQEFHFASINDLIGNDERLPKLLAELVLGDIIPGREYLKGNFALELSRLFQYDAILDEVQFETKRVLDSLESITATTETSIGLKLLFGSDLYNRDCSKIIDTQDTTCFSNSFKQNAEQQFFSNIIIGNDVIIETSIPVDPQDPNDGMTLLVEDLNRLSLSFAELIGSNTPVDDYDSGIVGDKLTLKIFPTNADYRTYMSILYGLDGNAGGLYIERNLTAYTYDRGEENTFTLTELVRHEYTHFLISKYLVPGFFGETEMWANQRLTMFDEGMANFVAGYTFTGLDEYLPLQTMVDRLSNPDLTIDESSRLTYSSGQLFEYSALLIGFLYETRRDTLNALFESLKSDDVSTYDSILAAVGDIDDNEFQSYLDSVRLDETSKVFFNHGEIGIHHVSTGTFTSTTTDIPPTSLPPNTTGTVVNLFKDGVQYGSDRIERYVNPVFPTAITTTIQTRENETTVVNKVIRAPDGTILEEDATPITLSNVSSRGFIGTGDDVLIGGFIVGGTQPRTVVIRGKAPDGIDRALTITNPELTLFLGSTVINTNDNWKDHPNVGLIPTGLHPTNDDTSVIAVVLEPGAYTAIVSGVGGDTGLGMIEVFYVDTVGPIQLTNISTRGMVGLGDNVLIGGLIITGESTGGVVIRAKGPSLSEFGINNALVDPVITLFSGSNVIDSSDNWKDHIRAVQIPEHLQPTNDSEAAIYADLPPGAYTAIVSGVGGGTGVGLVEVFQVNL